MPKFIVKLTDKKTKIDYYLNWSTIVDAPTSEPVALKDAMEYLLESFVSKGLGIKAYNNLIKTGCSSPYYSANEVIEGSDMSLDDLLDTYCRPFFNKKKNKIVSSGNLD